MLLVNDVNQIYLGIQGENEIRTISIDVNAWLADHPNGSISIWHKRNGDATPSATGAEYDIETGVISWSPDETDTYVAGEGQAEIRMTENGVIKKSKAIRTMVSAAVTGGGTTIGSDWQSYINEVDRLKSLAVAAAEDAEAAAEDAEAARDTAVNAKDAAEIAAGIAIAQAGQIKFTINSNGHLIFSYTDQVPVV